MEAVWLAIYILMWPVISIGVLALIWIATGIEMRKARRQRRELV